MTSSAGARARLRSDALRLLMTARSARVHQHRWCVRGVRQVDESTDTGNEYENEDTEINTHEHALGIRNYDRSVRAAGGNRAAQFFFTCAEWRDTYWIVVLDSQGNLYGTASTGGGYGNGTVSGNGTVYRVSPAGVITTL
jgi:isoaspartyl peptidase/L-asparaginase-like protein (Ntn-hydrolase superfamily)